MMNLEYFCVALCQGKLDDQLTDVEQLANHQAAYTHPLKPATQAQQRKLGEHNKKAVKLLRELQEHLRSHTAEPPAKD